MRQKNALKKDRAAQRLEKRQQQRERRLASLGDHDLKLSDPPELPSSLVGVEPPYRLYERFKVIKGGLKNFLWNPDEPFRDGKTLIECVNEVSRALGQYMFKAARLLEAFYLYELGNGRAIPDVNDRLINQTIQLIRRGHSRLTESAALETFYIESYRGIDQQANFEPSLPIPDNVIVAARKRFHTNCRVHIKKQYFRVGRDYIEQELKSHNVARARQVANRLIAELEGVESNADDDSEMGETDNEDQQQQSSSVLDQLRNRLFNELRESSTTYPLMLSKIYQLTNTQDNEAEIAVAVNVAGSRKSRRKRQRARNFVAREVETARRTRTVRQTNETIRIKRTTLLPHPSARPIFIDVDTRSLWGLKYGGLPRTGMPDRVTQTHFADRRVEYFLNIFNIPQKYFPRNAEPLMWQFNFLFGTDGKSISLYLKRWIPFQDLPKEQPARRIEQERRREAKTNAFDSYIKERYAQHEFDQVWAIDPGSINIATATSGVDAASEKQVLTNKAYVHESKTIQIMKAKSSKMTKWRIDIFNGQIPPFRGAQYTEYMVYLRYEVYKINLTCRFVLARDSRLRDIFDFEGTSAVKDLRLKTYIYRNKSMDKFVQRLRPGRRCLVFVGQGYYSGSYFLPGRRPSPKGASLVKALKKAGCIVRTVNEFNTSKVRIFSIGFALLIKSCVHIA